MMVSDDSDRTPTAWYEGFAQQDYEKVHESLRDDPGQALLAFGTLHTTLLHAASYDGKADLAELLIQLGADVNAKEVNGRRSGVGKQVVERLLQRGAMDNRKLPLL